MNVYVVIRCIDYEGEYIVNIFSSIRKAHIAIKAEKASLYGSYGDVHYEIRKMKIN